MLAYEPKTGIFTWLKSVAHRYSAGARAGSVTHGYRYISIDGTKYAAHRLAWFWSVGDWPPYDIDHRDGNKDNNSLDNLREAKRIQNQQNIRKAHIDNQCGLLGAYWDKRRGLWYSEIRSNGKRHLLGKFPTKEQAHAAYLAAKRQLHEFCEI